LQPRLKLNAAHLFALGLQVEQVFGLLDSITQFSTLFASCLVFGEHIKIILEDINGLIGLQCSLHLRVNVIQEVRQVIIFHS